MFLDIPTPKAGKKNRKRRGAGLTREGEKETMLQSRIIGSVDQEREQ